MSHRGAAAMATVIAVVYLTPSPTSGQSRDRRDADSAPTWTLPRTPDGQPDLQGFWTTQTFTPLERPEYLAGKEFFTEEEAVALQQQLTAAGVDPLARSAINLDDAEAREKRLRQAQESIHYDNAVWLRTLVPKGLSSRRTSLITKSAGRENSGLDAGSQATSGRSQAATGCLRRLRDPVLVRAVHRMGA